MLDHVSIGVRDFALMRRFYVRVLAQVGLRAVDEEADRFVDFIDARVAGVEFSLETPTNGEAATPGNGVHIVFTADTPAAVDAFFATALALGGTSDSAPAPRPQYGADYYGAFIHDPEGNKLEAVWGSRAGQGTALRSRPPSVGGRGLRARR
jgi:catechol 2,3-dioxygenase-like lactoylglutathione lyase family enzyme